MLCATRKSKAPKLEQIVKEIDPSAFLIKTSANEIYGEGYKKYEELDKSWRQKYKDRFFNSETTPNDVKNDQEDDVKDDAEEKTYADLFVEREG